MMTCCTSTIQRNVCHEVTLSQSITHAHDYIRPEQNVQVLHYYQVLVPVVAAVLLPRGLSHPLLVVVVEWMDMQTFICCDSSTEATDHTKVNILHASSMVTFTTVVVAIVRSRSK
jgi:hypothetical protein